ncbi:MAG: hypothetical protein PW843_17040 [Azospirillaceae bacterium]|nr:hypothetical protein [Azospirillaceae bacterium]
MLWEWIASCLTDCTPAARRLGYHREPAAIQARARRCRDAWAPHLACSREKVAWAAQAHGKGGTLLVLGSGALLDLPAPPELLTHFTSVILADIAHPPTARRQARRHAAVRLARVDLTGTVADIVGGRPLKPGCDAFTDGPAPDLVISLNVLSQLPLKARAQVAAQGDDIAADTLAADIVVAHLDHLARLNAPCLILTDVERRWLDADGIVRASEDPLFGRTLPGERLDSWPWAVAPLGEMAQGGAMETTVAAHLVRSGP